MEGKVIRVDGEAEGGILRGDDGKRYNFTSEARKECPKLVIGDTVDFDAEDSLAHSLLVIKSSAGEEAPKRQGTAPEPKASTSIERTSSDPIERLKNWAINNLQIVLAAIIILGCFFTYIATPELPMVESYSTSIFGIFSLLGAVSGFSDFAGSFGGGTGENTIETVLGFRRFFYLLYMIPLASLYLIYKEYNLTATKRTQMRAGMIAMTFPFGVPALTAILLYIYVSIKTAGEDNFSASSGIGELTPSIETVLSLFGMGAWLVTIAGALLVAVSRGWQPFANDVAEPQKCPECDSNNAASNDFCRNCGAALG